MGSTSDVTGTEAQALRGCVDFDGARVLEIGCGEGRLTWLYAHRAEGVLGIDPEEDAISLARERTPPELAERIRFEVGTAEDLSRTAVFDVAFLSWSL